MPDFPLTIVEALCAVLTMTLASFVQGAMGLGCALIAAPVLVLIDIRFVPGALICAGLAHSLLIVRRDLVSIRRGEIIAGVGGRVLGTAVAAYFLVGMDAALMTKVLGVLIIVAVIMTGSGWTFKESDQNIGIASVISGVMTTFCGIGGPPMALVYQHSEPQRFRGVMAFFFITGNVIALLGLMMIGRLGSIELLLGAILLPGVLLGYGLSNLVVPYINQRRLRIFLLFFSSLGAILAMVQAP